MQDDPVEGLLNDSASLWHLIQSIDQFVREQLASHTYTEPTVNFFEYVGKLAAGTKRILASPTSPSSPQDIVIARAKLATLKGYWRLLHELIKPAADAHSLAAPAVLIDFAALQLHQVAGLGAAQVVVSLSPRLMYHQTGHTKIAELGRKIEQVVPDAEFPPKLGFVALPYSQGSGFFANLLLYHELGHFVFEELSSVNRYESLLELDSKMAEAIDQAIANRPELHARAAFYLDILRGWTHEIFCDLFAISLIGPAFSFAFIDMLSLLGLVHGDQEIAFVLSHPAPACRFRQHLSILQPGWWDHLTDVKAPQKALLERLADRKEDEYKLLIDGKLHSDPLLIPTFCSMLKQISDVVLEITAPVVAKATDFAEHRRHVEKCLFNGVVPSVFIDRQKHLTVPPTSVINGSFTFYLTSLEKLMQYLEKDPLDVEERSVWTQRLESWTQKALEDLLLLDRCAGAR